VSEVQEKFLAAVMGCNPGISITEIGRRIGISRQAVRGERFNVPAAVAAWNEGGWEPRLEYVPASVKVKD